LREGVPIASRNTPSPLRGEGWGEGDSRFLRIISSPKEKGVDWK